jgi:hypothetical protein
MEHDQMLRMSFTRDEWRIMAVALAKLKPSEIIGGQPRIDIAKKLALMIAVETGK